MPGGIKKKKTNKTPHKNLHLKNLGDCLSPPPPLSPKESKMLLKNILPAGGGRAAVLDVAGRAQPGFYVAAESGGGNKTCPISLAKVNCTGRYLETLLMVSLHNAFIGCLWLETYPSLIFLFILLVNSYKITTKVRAWVWFPPRLYLYAGRSWCPT